MPAPEDFAEYLDGALDEAREAEWAQALADDSELCAKALQHRRLERLLPVILAATERTEPLRASIRAALQGRTMERLRAEVLARTSHREPSWWQILFALPKWSIALAALLVLGVIAGFLEEREGSHAAVDALQLAERVDGLEVRRSGHPVAVVAGLPLEVGDEVRVGAKPVALRFAREATTITLEPETTIMVRALVPQKKFDLVQGGLSAEVAKQHTGAMLWTTDNAEARVLGTKFALTADGVFTRLDVERGAVELQRRGSPEQTLVRAGEFAASDSRTLLEARPQATAPIWNVPARQTPGFVHTAFTSQTGGMEMGVNILLPPRYDETPERRFPVLYFSTTPEATSTPKPRVSAPSCAMR